MSKLTREEKLRRYHAIYDQIYLNPRIHVHEISRNLRMARNTISGYLDHMYESQILFGPELRLKYYSELDEYVYLARVDDPYAAFKELQRDPEIIYCCMFLGDWNIMFMADKDYNAPHICGFEDVLLKGARRDITSPRIPLVGWRAAFQRMKEIASEFDPDGLHETESVIHNPPKWDDEEWKLFYEYKYNFRKKVTPVLRKYLISSDKFYRWLDTLPEHASVNLRFYPDEYENYTHFTFLFKTKYPQAVISLLSHLPTSPGCTEIDGGVITMLSIKSDLTFAELYATIHKMKISGMIEGFNHAIAVFHYYETEEEFYVKLP